MKSYETYVMTLYSGIMVDASIRWPDIVGAMEKDMSYLLSAMEHRGLTFFTLTLPDFGHWLDMSLDQGRFADRESIPRGIPMHRGDPVLFRGFLRRVFQHDGVLRSDADVEAVFFLRSLCQGMKKVELPYQPATLKKTLQEFFDVEQALPPPHLETWDCEVPNWRCREGHPLYGGSPQRGETQLSLDSCGINLGPHPPWDTLRQLCRRVTAEFGVPDWWDLRPKHGPGAVSEKGWKSKYEFPAWSQRLELWFPFDWFGSGQLDPDFEPSRGELPSRLCAVPKTVKGPRLICAEPLSNQWIQQGIWGWIRDRIKSTVLGRSISFESQASSQKWALAGSLDRSFATIDLSAASDRLCTRLVEYIFQGSEILDGIHACRTQFMEQKLADGLPKLIRLRKFATMGSALTFPVQTIVFTILCVWALRLYEGRENDWKNWEADFDRVRVFGDDIIVPNHAYRITKFVLHECGLLVNDRKSYEGLTFRESCGMDAFKGVDVTPVRPKHLYSGSASSTAALVETSNNLYMKGLWYASTAMLGLLPARERKLLLVMGPDDAHTGLCTFGKSDLHLRERRWDRDLQRSYVWSLSFRTRSNLTLGPGRSSLTQYFTELPSAQADRPPIWRDYFDWASGRRTTTRLQKKRVRHYL